MSYLLIIANTPSPNAKLLFDAVIRGAEETGYPIVKKTPLEASAKDFLLASGVIIGTTENFGYMSGLIKDMFERIYYPCLEGLVSLDSANDSLNEVHDKIVMPEKAGMSGKPSKNTEGLPWALYVKAGLDGTGATNSVQKRVSGMRWKAVQEPLLLHGKFKDEFIEECETLGAGMAEGLKLGIF